MAITKKEVLEEISLSERVVLTLSDGYTFDVCPATDYVGGGNGYYMCDILGNIEFDSVEECVSALFRYLDKEGLEIEEIKSVNIHKLVKHVANEKDNFQIVSVLPDLIIYKLDGECEHPFKFIYRPVNNVDKDCWLNGWQYLRSVDETMLAYFEARYLGMNSQFAYFASKMLGIKVV